MGALEGLGTVESPLRVAMNADKESTVRGVPRSGEGGSLNELFCE